MTHLRQGYGGRAKSERKPKDEARIWRAARSVWSACSLLSLPPFRKPRAFDSTGPPRTPISSWRARFRFLRMHWVHEPGDERTDPSPRPSPLPKGRGRGIASAGCSLGVHGKPSFAFCACVGTMNRDERRDPSPRPSPLSEGAREKDRQRASQLARFMGSTGSLRIGTMNRGERMQIVGKETSIRGFALGLNSDVLPVWKPALGESRGGLDRGSGDQKLAEKAC